MRPRHVLNLLTALSVGLAVAASHGCVSRAAWRPTLREDGRVLSVLAFPAGRDDITVPVVRQGPLLLTDAVTVNGQSAGWFVVDTGATWTTIDHKAARPLGITAVRPWSTSSDGSRDGLYMIERLDVARLTLSNHLIGVMDLSSLATGSGRTIIGALGGDVLGAVPFTVDFVREELVLHRRESFRPPPGVDEYPVKIQRPRRKGSYVTANPAAGSPRVAAVVDGVRTTLSLDTGGGVSLLVGPRLVAKRPQWVEPSGEVLARVTGGAGPAGLAGLELVRADVRYIDAMGARFHCDGTARAVKPPAVGREPGILGMPFLSHGRLTFDYATKRVWPEWRGDRGDDRGAEQDNHSGRGKVTSAPS